MYKVTEEINVLPKILREIFETKRYAYLETWNNTSTLPIPTGNNNTMNNTMSIIYDTYRVTDWLTGIKK